VATRWRTSAALALAFAALATLVWAGAFTWLDQWAVVHLMPTLRAEPPLPLTRQLVPFANAHGAFDVLAGAVLLVGHPLVSTALALWLAARTGPPRRVRVLAGFAAVVALEIAFKHVVERPALHLGSFHLEGFDHSFPSGHATRTAYLAVVAAALYPRAARWLVIAVALFAALLVVDGSHTPTDVVGGILLAVALNPRLGPGRSLR
jgi:membrane-associated phospholipid phosphatase